MQSIGHLGLKAVVVKLLQECSAELNNGLRNLFNVLLIALSHLANQAAEAELPLLLLFRSATGSFVAELHKELGI